MDLLSSSRRHPSAVLLVVQLGGVLVYPAMEGSGAAGSRSRSSASSYWSWRCSRYGAHPG